MTIRRENCTSLESKNGYAIKKMKPRNKVGFFDFFSEDVSRKCRARCRDHREWWMACSASQTDEPHSHPFVQSPLEEWPSRIPNLAAVIKSSELQNF